MASKINYTLIDEEYPVAGEDNDSQGFRDNFDAIKKGLKNANEEVTDLQNNAARTDQDNNFEDHTIERANLKNFTQTSIVEGTIPTDTNSTNEIVSIDITKGVYRSYTVANDVALTFTNWPEENYAGVIIELRPDYPDNDTIAPPPYTVAFQNDGGGKIIKDTNTIWLQPYEYQSVKARIGEVNPEIGPDSTPDIKVKIFRFWTHDGGETIYASYLGSFNTSSPPDTGENIIERLNDISDVNAEAPNEGDTIVYNQENETWETGPGGSAKEISILSANNDFTITPENINHYIRVSSFGTVDVTVPFNATDIPVGTSVTLFQAGEGTIKINPESGVFIYSTSGFLTTRDQYSAMTLTKIDENRWDLIGDLAEFVFVCGVSWLALGDDQYLPKNVLIGDTSPVESTLSLFGTTGEQLLHLTDPYGNPVSGSFSIVDNLGHFEAHFSTDGTTHDLLFRVTDNAVEQNNYTLGNDFAADEAVIYFRPEFDSANITEANYTLRLTYRDPAEFTAFSSGTSASIQTMTITAEDYDADPNKIYAIPFPSPGPFNGISIECDGVAGAIVDFRLCKDSAQMVWPFTTLIPTGVVTDDPIIITNFTSYV